MARSLDSARAHRGVRFIDAYAIVGPPSVCVERILQIVELGVDHLMLSPPLGDASESDRRDGYRRLVAEVLPQVRAALPPSPVRPG